MNQSSDQLKYTIKQVAERTDLSRQVLRKWEERYEIVRPERLENGYRVYSEEDIQLFLRMKQFAEEGHPLQMAAALALKSSTAPEQQPNPFVRDLLAAGTDCNEAELNFTLQTAYQQLGLSDYLQTVVIPFLRLVGERWASGEWNEYQEALASISVRDQLVQLRRNFQCRADAPLLLGACLPHEAHELPLHIALLQLMLNGWKTVLVGASPAPGAIQSLIKTIRPQKVLLSATTTLPFEINPDMIAELDRFAADHQEIDFYLGGRGALLYQSQLPLQSISIAETIDQI